MEQVTERPPTRVREDETRLLVSKSVEKEDFHCTRVSCSRVIRKETLFLLAILGCIKGQVVEKFPNEIVPPLLWVEGAMDPFHALIRDLFDSGDWVEPDALVVPFGIAVSLKKEIELLYRCGSFVAFAFVVSEVQEGERVFIFSFGDNREC
jgi:hypothetical protein